MGRACFEENPCGAERFEVKILMRPLRVSCACCFIFPFSQFSGARLLCVCCLVPGEMPLAYFASLRPLRVCYASPAVSGPRRNRRGAFPVRLLRVCCECPGIPSAGDCGAVRSLIPSARVSSGVPFFPAQSKCGIWHCILDGLCENKNFTRFCIRDPIGPQRMNRRRVANA